MFISFGYLLVLNILDFLSGVINAIIKKNLSSGKMKKGGLFKILIWIVITVSVILGNILHIKLYDKVLIYYAIMECLSIFENIIDYVPIPNNIKNVLENFKEVDENGKR